MTDGNQPSSDEQVEQPFLSHLFELRDRLLRALLAILLIFICLFPFANDIYTFMAEPLMKHMPENSSMIATDVASPFLTPFKLTLMTAIALGMPVILFQLWSFVAPALYRNERRLVFPLMFASTLLFFGGILFAYFAVFPIIFGFFIGVTPEGVTVMTDISKYLDFILKLFFAFGLAFEIPIATILMVWTGFTTAKKLSEKRPYVIVGAFVFGMLLTPPDIISQTLLAIPMWLLFEAGIFFSRFFIKPDADSQEEEETHHTKS